MVATTERAITADGAGERDRYTLSVLAEIEWDGAAGIFGGATKYGEVCDGPVPTPE